VRRAVNQDQAGLSRGENIPSTSAQGPYNADNIYIPNVVVASVALALLIGIPYQHTRLLSSSLFPYRKESLYIIYCRCLSLRLPISTLFLCRFLSRSLCSGLSPSPPRNSRPKVCKQVLFGSRSFPCVLRACQFYICLYIDITPRSSPLAFFSFLQSPH
jgi:hypothetical protein